MENLWGQSSRVGLVMGTPSQPMLFGCMGICVLSPAHECEMRGSLVYLLIVKYRDLLDGLVFEFFWRFFETLLDIHLHGVYSPYGLIYLLCRLATLS